MNTSPAVPALSTLVEMTGSDGPVPGVRVDAVQGPVLTLSPPNGAHSPAVGERLVLRWSAGVRGRYALAGTVLETTAGDRLTVRTEAEAEIEQQRNFVRGGGGEPIRMRRPASTGSAEYAGWIRDISERGVRAHFAEAAVRDGDPLCLRIQLDADVIDVTGTALKVSALPSAEDMRVEVVAVIDTDEAQAQIIRRYVLRHQLLTRVRTAGD
jgi:hypothetical protein